MSTSFDNLINLANSIEPSYGEKCSSFGNNIYNPIDGGISDFNKGVVTMSPYGNYEIALTEAVEYEYDTQLLFDNLKPIEDFFKNKLKEQNRYELQLHKTQTSKPNYNSAIGFMRGNGDVESDEKEVINDLQNVEHESKYPPVLSNDIQFESKHAFLNVLKHIFAAMPDDKLNTIINNASGFISEFSINSYRNFIDIVKSEISSRNYSNKVREPRSFR